MPMAKDYERFTEYLRDEAGEKWTAIVNHPFTDALTAGTIDHDAMRLYLIQDHMFLDCFVVLLSSMVAAAPSLKDRIPGCQFLALITGKENTYFERSLEALGVTEQQRKEAEVEKPTEGFLALMVECAKSGSLHKMLCCLCVAEWSYLSWGTRVKVNQKDSSPFWCNEWIELHCGEYFESVIAYFRGLLDTEGKKLDDAGVQECVETFNRAVLLEVEFFDMAWAVHTSRQKS